MVIRLLAGKKTPAIEHYIIRDNHSVRADASTGSAQGTSVRGDASSSSAQGTQSVSNHNGCIEAQGYAQAHPSIPQGERCNELCNAR